MVEGVFIRKFKVEEGRLFNEIEIETLLFFFFSQTSSQTQQMSFISKYTEPEYHSGAYLEHHETSTMEI